MYVVCYIDESGNNTWDIVTGDAAMLEKVDELINDLMCDAEDIMVFDVDSQLS